jgi:N-acylglucosamine 2-epimerase
MEKTRIDELHEHYRGCLFDDVIPFWLSHSLDREYGGYLTCLDRDGSVLNTDKSMWFQGRGTWLFSRLCNALQPRDEWLDAAKCGFDFLVRYGFDTDSRMFYTVTRDGRPLRKRRYLFTETFGIIACAEYARATGDAQALRRARDTYRLVVDLYRTPGALAPKVFPQTRVTRSHAVPMILLATTQVLRQADSDPLYTQVIDDSLDQILNHFLKRDERALFETVGPNGERLDSPDGRCLNPGHAIETAWFIMQEGRYRNDPSLVQGALDILNWSLERGWDKEYGGILSFVDVEGRSPEQIEWDMKLWWPHTEALCASLLAHHLTGEARYLEWYEKVHAWAFGHFPDPEFGEWFGYLHRDGSVSLPVKGSMWKGPFHLPRALLQCLELLEEMDDEGETTSRSDSRYKQRAGSDV